METGNLAAELESELANERKVESVMAETHADLLRERDALVKEVERLRALVIEVGTFDDGGLQVCSTCGHLVEEVDGSKKPSCDCLL